MKIGILGGSFNPVHKMHILLCKKVKEAFALDKVWLMPTYQNPFKLGKKIACASMRLDMCRLCAKDCDFLEVSSIEATSSSPCYTVETMTRLKREFPEDEFFFILGSDTAKEVTRWRDFSHLCSLVTFIIADREPEDAGSLEKIREEIISSTSAEAKVEMLLGFSPNSISSTAIRAGLLYGEDVGEYVQESVMEYIEKNRVYFTLSSVEAHLKEILSPKRFLHSMNVAKKARELAVRYSLAQKKAYFAGLIHDCAKELSPEQTKALLEQGGVSFSPTEEANPSLRHQMLGALYAAEVFGVEDEDVLNAVAFHTSARANMSSLEQVIYLADLTSEDRDYPDVEKVRELCEKSLGAAMSYSLAQIIKLVEKKGGVLDERALEALKFFNSQKNS